MGGSGRDVLDGASATARITAEHPGTAVLVLTTFADDASIGAALAAGACGYLTKASGRAEIVAAIRSAAIGQSTFAAPVAARLVAVLAAEPAPRRPSDVDPVGLTGREREVLALIARGLSKADIAAELYVGAATVKTHVNNAFAKIGVTSRTEAARYAFRAGLATP